MEPLIVNYKQSDIVRTLKALGGLYFLAFCGYFVSAEAAIDSYGILFCTAAAGALMGLLIFLYNTLWTFNKKLLLVDQLKIESNVRLSKFKIDWVHVSKVNIFYSSIYIYTNGGKKEKILNLSEIHLKDVLPLKQKLIEICDYKSIPYTNE